MIRLLLANALAVALCAVQPACNADSLGRLFTTEQERAALDSHSGIKLANRGQGPADPARQLRVNGTVISSSGHKKLWVDGKTYAGNNPDEPRARVLDSRQVWLDTSDGKHGSVLKPGQVLNLDTGRVYESFMLDRAETKHNALDTP